jgi:hypothetical protein
MPAELKHQPIRSGRGSFPARREPHRYSAAILPSFCPTDLYQAARPRITLNDQSACTPADQGECDSGKPCRTDPDASHPAENCKVGGSIPSLPITVDAPGNALAVARGAALVGQGRAPHDRAVLGGDDGGGLGVGVVAGVLLVGAGRDAGGVHIGQGVVGAAGVGDHVDRDARGRARSQGAEAAGDRVRLRPRR